MSADPANVSGQRTSGADKLGGKTVHPVRAGPVRFNETDRRHAPGFRTRSSARAPVDSEPMATVTRGLQVPGLTLRAPAAAAAHKTAAAAPSGLGP